MSTKQELRDEIDELIRGRNSWRREANALGRRLLAALDERNVAAAELAEARATIAQLRDQLAARQADEPAPRPFQVGDRVRVAEGATWRAGDVRPRSAMSGRSGAVWRVYSDGDVSVRADDGVQQDAVSPEFCTLVEDQPEPEARVYAIRSDTPPGLVVTEDGALLNWEGENYVRQPATDRTPERVTLTLEDGTRITFDAVVTR